MYTRTRRAVMAGVPVMALLVLLLPYGTEAEFPDFKTLSQTNVSLKIDGFRFASGLQLEGDRPNGDGTQRVPAGWCGSGFLVKSDGTLITNYHVAQHMLKGTAIFQSGATYEIAHLRVYDRGNDIAILQLRTTEPLPTVQLGNSDQVQVMDKVLAVGNPLSLPHCRDFSVTDGSVNQLRRASNSDTLELLQHSAPLAPGNSGGALYRDKEVIGINVASYPPYQVHYAIPINKAKPLLEEYADRTIKLEDAFPADLNVMEKKFKEVLARPGQVEAMAGRNPALWKMNVAIGRLTDVAVSLQGPQLADLALAIWDAQGKPLGFGARSMQGRELVLLSNSHPQTVTIGVLNFGVTPANFGVKVYDVHW